MARSGKCRCFAFSVQIVGEVYAHTHRHLQPACFFAENLTSVQLWLCRCVYVGISRTYGIASWTLVEVVVNLIDVFLADGNGE